MASCTACWCTGARLAGAQVHSSNTGSKPADLSAGSAPSWCCFRGGCRRWRTVGRCRGASGRGGSRHSTPQGLKLSNCACTGTCRQTRQVSCMGGKRAAGEPTTNCCLPPGDLSERWLATAPTQHVAACRPACMLGHAGADTICCCLLATGAPLAPCNAAAAYGAK